MLDGVRAAIQSLPCRERKVIGLYYYGELTMKQIGAEIGVNESRVSQLHARAVRRLRDALRDMNPRQVAEVRRQLLEFATRKTPMAKAHLPTVAANAISGVVLPYKTVLKRGPARATLKVGRSRQAV